MNCSHCVKTVGDSLKNIEGVADVDVSLETGKVIVNGSGVKKEELTKAVEGVGYKVKE